MLETSHMTMSKTRVTSDSHTSWQECDILESTQGAWPCRLLATKTQLRGTNQALEYVLKHCNFWCIICSTPQRFVQSSHPSCPVYRGLW